MGITRYSMLITVMNVSSIVATVCWIVWAYTMSTNALGSMFPLLYQSFDAVLDSVCLFLFYSYGDASYHWLCLCKKNDALKFCALHRCCEKCCVGLAKQCAKGEPVV